MTTRYAKHRTAQPEEIDLDAIISATRAAHDARTTAEAWQITQRAIRRWTRRRYVTPLGTAAPQPTRTTARRMRPRTV